MSHLEKAIMAAGLTLLAVGLIALWWAGVRASDQVEHVGADADWHPAATLAADADEEEAALAAATDRITATVTAAAAETPAEMGAHRDCWCGQQPWCPTHGLGGSAAEQLPIVPGRQASRHHEDTVEMVAADWMPLIGARRNALLCGDAGAVPHGA